MKRVYRIPIMGGVVNDKPLKGVESNPLCAIPLDKLPECDALANEDRGFSYVVLLYNLDEEEVEVELDATDAFHDWLLNLIPQLKGIAKGKGWKLDKTELVKTKLARGEKV
ncbi:hypothetical protein ES703_29755 [subsurface metagenome]